MAVPLAVLPAAFGAEDVEVDVSAGAVAFIRRVGIGRRAPGELGVEGCVGHRADMERGSAIAARGGGREAAVVLCVDLHFILPVGVDKEAGGGRGRGRELRDRLGGAADDAPGVVHAATVGVDAVSDAVEVGERRHVDVVGGDGVGDATLDAGDGRDGGALVGGTDTGERELILGEGRVVRADDNLAGLGATLHGGTAGGDDLGRSARCERQRGGRGCIKREDGVCRSAVVGRDGKRRDVEVLAVAELGAVGDGEGEATGDTVHEDFAEVARVGGDGDAGDAAVALEVDDGVGIGALKRGEVDGAHVVVLVVGAVLDREGLGLVGRERPGGLDGREGVALVGDDGVDAGRREGEVGDGLRGADRLQRLDDLNAVRRRNATKDNRVGRCVEPAVGGRCLESNLKDPVKRPAALDRLVGLDAEDRLVAAGVALGTGEGNFDLVAGLGAAIEEGEVEGLRAARKGKQGAVTADDLHLGDDELRFALIRNVDGLLPRAGHRRKGHDGGVVAEDRLIGAGNAVRAACEGHGARNGQEPKAHRHGNTSQRHPERSNHNNLVCVWEKPDLHSR